MAHTCGLRSARSRPGGWGALWWRQGRVARSPWRAQGWQVWGLGAGEPGSRPGGGQGKGSQNVLEGVVPASRPRWALDWGHNSEPETGPQEASDKAQVRSWGPLDGQGASPDGSGLRPDPCGRKGVGGRGERRPRGWAVGKSLAFLPDSRKQWGLGTRAQTPPPSSSLQEHQGPALANGGSPKDSPAHEVTGGGAYTRFDVPRPRIRRSWPSFRALLLHRYVVARVIWADMLSIAVTYFITLCLFPGLESEIRHCILGEWLPILLMAVFNLSDFVGKILAALPMDWRGTHLLACSCLRVVFIPLFILCVYPSGTPALRHPAWPCVLSLLMGISNGYFGSVPMILAAGKVGPKQRELAGNTMTVSYMTGLTLGSAVAYCTYSLTRDAHRSCLRPSAANASFPAGL